MEFSPLIKGTPDWNEKYNQDIGGLCAEMDAARSSGILNTYVHTKSGTAHTLTGEGAIMRFTATAGWAAGDTISVNGLGKNPVTLEGTALPAGAFAQGTQVVAVVDGENLQFLTQSYAGQFDAISTQMSNKADKSRTVLDSKRDYQNYTTVLEMVNAVSDGGTVIAFGDNQSPLFNAEDRPPVLSEYFYVVLSDGLRKNVIAFGFTGRNIYMRRVWSRVWSTDWTQAATCYCADMEWKALPMVNGWINAVGDPAAALKYRKGADGKVIYVEGYIKQPEALTTDNRIFAYLPEGYRPKSYWWRPTVHEYKEGMVPLRVNLDGKMYITSINANIQTITNHSLPICLTIPI